MKTTITVLCLCVCALLAGCGEKKEPTEKEKGKENVVKKLDYAEGAAEALNDQGNEVGRASGKGVGDLLKGIGSGIVDAVYPPVKIDPTVELTGAGIKINKAEEGSHAQEGHEVNMVLAFAQIYKGRVELRAFDKANVEMGRGTSRLLNQPAD